MKDLTKAWLEAAAVDLESARRLSDDHFLTPAVAFHSQQVVEKSFKAILEELTEDVPKIHNVLKLYELVSEHRDILCDVNLLQQINDVYIDTRYPSRPTFHQYFLTKKRRVLRDDLLVTTRIKFSKGFHGFCLIPAVFAKQVSMKIICAYLDNGKFTNCFC